MLKRTLDIALAALFACSLQAQMVTPSKLRFEVASIKPSSGFGECVSRDPGRFTCKGSLKRMLFQAFEVPQYQQLDPAFARASPAYDQVYEVVASVPKEAAKNFGIPPKGNSEEVRAMLRNLLIDRFKLAYHYEKKEVPGYSLTADKPGFKPKSDPNSKPIGAPKDYVPPAGSISPRWHAPAESWLDVTRASMGQFAEGLSRWVFKGIPITDDTGLKDVYSFNLHYLSLENPFGAAPTTEAPEPLPTIFQELGRQGLKLTSKKVMADFLVIDHVEKSPTAN
jgi:uncharacterized protein (TIGR03435 family)